MSLTDSQIGALNKFGSQAVAEMKIAVRSKKISNYRRSSVNASGDLDRSIEYKIVPDGLEIYCNEYVYYLIYGRKPSTPPPFQAIREWIDEKGIMPEAGMEDKDKDSMAWAIVKSIAKKGTTIFRTFGGSGSGLFAEVFDEESLKELEDGLAGAITVEFESILLNEFNNSTL